MMVHLCPRGSEGVSSSRCVRFWGTAMVRVMLNLVRLERTDGGDGNWVENQNTGCVLGGGTSIWRKKRCYDLYSYLPKAHKVCNILRSCCCRTMLFCVSFVCVLTLTSGELRHVYDHEQRGAHPVKQPRHPASSHLVRKGNVCVCVCAFTRVFGKRINCRCVF